MGPVKPAFPTLLAIATLLGPLQVSPVEAKGRRPDREETVFDARRVRRGSPANPNAAFQPPKFEDDIRVAPEEDNRKRSNNPQDDLAPSPYEQQEALPPPPPQAAPPPPAPVAPPATYEPPLPEETPAQ